MSNGIGALYNALVTVAVAPGILAHEYAHVFACRLTGVTVEQPPRLGLFEPEAVLEHEPVETFTQDFAIAIAPLLGNSVLAAAAFALVGPLDGQVTIVPLWFGVTFGLTALPSDGDTASLVAGAGTLDRSLRPLGYLLALPIRLVSYSTVVAGLLALCWTVTLYTVAAGV